MYVLWGAKLDKIHKKNSLSRMIPKDCLLQLPQPYAPLFFSGAEVKHSVVQPSGFTTYLADCP